MRTRALRARSRSSRVLLAELGFVQAIPLSSACAELGKVLCQREREPFGFIRVRLEFSPCENSGRPHGLNVKRGQGGSPARGVCPEERRRADSEPGNCPQAVSSFEFAYANSGRFLPTKRKARAGLSPCPRFTPGRIRTFGQRLRRPLLCPLSYGRELSRDLNDPLSSIEFEDISNLLC